MCLVEKISSGDYFAMKIIDRDRAVEKQQEAYIESEVSIMRTLNTDFAVKLYYSFQTASNLFFVMDYMNGGDFGGLLSNCSPISEDVLPLCHFLLERPVLPRRNLRRHRILTREWDPAPGLEA